MDLKNSFQIYSFQFTAGKNQMKRLAFNVALVLILCFLTQGFACSGVNKQRNVAFAKDVVNSLQSALPLVRELNPRAGEVLARAVPIAQKVVTAIEQGDAKTAIEMLELLLPIINDTAAEFTGNTKVLTILALADIAIHFLINHQPALVKEAVNSAARDGKASAIADYAKQPTWGCTYRADLCK